jgi:FtsP/CotA-like multicopper oxidase with cupredoxin domain
MIDVYANMYVIYEDLYIGKVTSIQHQDQTHSPAMCRHGLHQNQTNFYDGTEGVTQCGIPPGETMTYNFTLDGWTGTTWWQYVSRLRS